MESEDLDNSSSHSEHSRHPPVRNVSTAIVDDDPDSWDCREFDAASESGSASRSNALTGDNSVSAIGRHRRSGSTVSEYDLNKCRSLLAAIEKRLTATSNPEDEGSLARKLSATADGRPELQVNFEIDIKHSVAEQRTTAEMCERTWTGFTNKFVDEEIEPALEILCEDPDYSPRRTTAKADRKRDNPREATFAGRKDGKKSATPTTYRTMPNRIRVNSMPILKFLTQLDDHIDTTAPWVILRPFKLLVHHDEQIRDSIQFLEHQVSLDLESTAATSDGIDYERSATSTDRENRKQTLEHMRVLVSFLDEYIRPTLLQLHGSANVKVHFADLWHLFKPGDDIYMPLKIQDTSVGTDTMGTTPETFQSRYNQVWRVTNTSGGRLNIYSAQSRSASMKPNNFKVDCYYIDFHGRYFRPTVHTFEITPFKDGCNITSLEFYPSRFLRKGPLQQSLDGNLEKGKIVFDAMAHSYTHFFYSGPSLMVHPCGCALTDGPVIQEHIESEVIVDGKMTLRQHPTWAPKREPWKEPVAQPGEVNERFPIRYWGDRAKTKMKRSELDQVYNDYTIDRERAFAFLNTEHIFAPIPSGWLENSTMVPPNDIKLLPSRVFAFVLRTRTFVPLWLSGLQPIAAKKEGLENLQLKDNSFKETLQALVKTHFMQRLTQNAPNFEYDIVRGKGRGLVILLHGAPGVGKTFTAESVAAANGQPLLQITCGDLGLKPKEVDIALKEIFHYAQHWKCVLLLDECDIFLTQRTKTDVKRNALVSVFLRVLEFYTGVLFLTTNRVGALDEAIKSRITWIAYYPPLNQDQTREIWKTNITRAQKGSMNLDVDHKGILAFARRHYKASLREGAVWNGRRIQNAFKVATALAEWEACTDEARDQTQLLLSSNDDGRRAILKAKHFETYANGTGAFDAYFKQAIGMNDADRAYHAMERNDDYEPDEENNGGFVPFSPSRDGGQFLSTSPSHHKVVNKRSASNLAPPSPHIRAASPGSRPGLSARQSTSQMPSHQHSPSFSRSKPTLSLSQPVPPRRRSGQAVEGGWKGGPSAARDRRSSYKHRPSSGEDEYVVEARDDDDDDDLGQSVEGRVLHNEEDSGEQSSSESG